MGLAFQPQRGKRQTGLLCRTSETLCRTGGNDSHRKGRDVPLHLSIRTRSLPVARPGLCHTGTNHAGVWRRVARPAHTACLPAQLLVGLRPKGFHRSPFLPTCSGKYGDSRHRKRERTESGPQQNIAPLWRHEQRTVARKSRTFSRRHRGSGP
ncbi:hypothetical protein IMSAGC014_02140 [Bacteroidaceae bacterium]|nr:hypothetical protein IMSAGC014_02140 [Bacteroidaceae bacterium]